MVSTAYELKNAYIGEYIEPASKTLLYAPCRTNLNNTVDWATPSASANTSLSWWYLYCNKWYCHRTLPESYPQNQPFTVNCFFKVIWRDSYNWRIFKSEWFEVWCSNNQNVSKYNIPLWTISNGWDSDAGKAYVIANCPTTNLNQRYNVCMTFDGTNTIMYLNGVSFIPWTNYTTRTWTNTYCWCWTTNNYDKFYWYIWDMLMEKWAWTQQEVLNWFNSNKANYWIS
jgi:hypothetical protein